MHLFPHGAGQGRHWKAVVLLAHGSGCHWMWAVTPGQDPEQLCSNGVQCSWPHFGAEPRLMLKPGSGLMEQELWQSPGFGNQLPWTL